MAKKLRFFKYLIALAAIINLAALFIFQYNLLPDSDDKPTETEYIPKETSADSAWSFQFESDTLTYDGSTKLDLLNGVTITDPSGKTVSDIEIFSAIKTNNNLSSKTIEYNADTADGRISASRTLQLTNYHGPSVTLSNTAFTLEEEAFDNISQALIASGDLKADDGFGNDISDSLQADYAQNAAQPTLIHCTFTVTNMFNDTYTAEADVSLSLTKPLLVLTQDTVTIQKGSIFIPADYIKTVINTDGTPIPDQVTIDGNVDTSTPGTYTLTYQAYNYDWIYSDSRTLTVTVTE